MASRQTFTFASWVWWYLGFGWQNKKRLACSNETCACVCACFVMVRAYLTSPTQGGISTVHVSDAWYKQANTVNPCTFVAKHDGALALDGSLQTI